MITFYSVYIILLVIKVYVLEILFRIFDSMRAFFPAIGKYFHFAIIRLSDFEYKLYLPFHKMPCPIAIWV